MATNDTTSVNRAATDWLVTRFIGSGQPSGDDSFSQLVDEHFADDAAMRHVVRIVRGADAPERFDVMPESIGLRAIVDGAAAAGQPDTSLVFDSLLALIRQRIASGAAIETNPLRDITTALPNRLLLLDRLATAIAIAHRHDKMLAVCSIRFDFTPVMEHEPRVALEIADRLRNTMREIDTLARLGTDEFAVVITDVAKRDQADVAIAKMSEVLVEPFVIGEQAHILEPHIGVSLYPPHGHDAASLLDAARAAAAAAKNLAVFGDK